AVRRVGYPLRPCHLGHEVMGQVRLAGHRCIGNVLCQRPAADYLGGLVGARHPMRRDDMTALAADTGPNASIRAAILQAGWATIAEAGRHLAPAAAAVGTRLVQVSSGTVLRHGGVPQRGVRPTGLTTHRCASSYLAR